MNFKDDVTDEEYNKNINRTILGGNVIIMYLIIIEVKYNAIDTGDSSFNRYYIINFS